MEEGRKKGGREEGRKEEGRRGLFNVCGVWVVK
jgi:hypothetical protein